LLSAACGAGHHAQTSQEVPAIPGVDAATGPIALCDLLIPFRQGGYPVGSEVPLVVRMFNNSPAQPVELSQVAPGNAGAMMVAAQRIVVQQPALAASGAPSPLVVAGHPAGGLPLVGTGIRALPRRRTPHRGAAGRRDVPVRFTFSTGDSVSVDVPMAPPTYPLTGPSGSTSPTSQPTARALPHPSG
jgi:hypothetical protein